MPRREFQPPPVKSAPKRTKQNTTTMTSPAPTGPDFTNSCHFTMQLFSCSHKQFLRNPKITHVLPCDLQSAPKFRCSNMASTSKEVYIRDDCPKCKEELASRIPKRPTTLGLKKNGNMVEMVQARLNELEPTSGKVNGKKVEAPKATSSADGFEIISLEEAQANAKPAQTQTAEASTKPAVPKQETTFQPEVPANKSPIDLEHKFRTDPDFRQREKEFWLSMPSAPNGTKRGLLSRLSGMFSSSAPTVKETEKDAQIKRDWAYVTSDQGKVEVDMDVEDDDWVHVDDSERKK